jgi:menaquinol-cytochrome c reductase iron-sulfur subunit
MKEMEQATAEAEGAVAADEHAQTLSRRDFMVKLSLAIAGVAALLAGLPVIGFILAPIFQRQPQVWQKVGALDQFKENATVEVSFTDASPVPWAGVTARTAAWLRREPGNKFTAFSVNCTHLGCPVRWLPDAKIFMCPCHGGGYYSDGTVAAGPPPQPLHTYPVRINNGQVEILTTPIPIG